MVIDTINPCTPSLHPPLLLFFFSPPSPFTLILKEGCAPKILKLRAFGSHEDSIFTAIRWGLSLLSRCKYNCTKTTINRSKLAKYCITTVRFSFSCTFSPYIIYSDKVGLKFLTFFCCPCYNPYNKTLPV